LYNCHNFLGRKKEGRRKKEEGRRKKEEGRRKKEEGKIRVFLSFHPTRKSISGLIAQVG
jgi:hypothetical protein